MPLAIVLWLVVEFLLAWLIISVLGGLVFWLSLIAGVVVGVYLLRGLRPREVIQALVRGETQALTASLSRALAGVLFLIPGPLSDLIALVVLLSGGRWQPSWGGRKSPVTGGRSPGRGDVYEGSWSQEPADSGRAPPPIALPVSSSGVERHKK